ncbi:MAG: hypothetical protein KDC87_07145 [Planctomycetes bacterium]|nr:hypothetical protein [Planctomycetota bacterium]MCB9868232.1 hypothetical protein [Planctomycetota bacterium]MCB9888792.1 hypothetical protein [Planctomycetota bacterium]
MKNPLSLLGISLTLALSLSLGSCESMSGMTGGSIDGTLKSIASLTTSISDWKAKLSGGNLTETALKQLGSLTGKAGGLGTTLKGLLGKAPAEQKDKLQPVQAGLSNLASFDLSRVLGLDEAGRKAEVDSVTNAASSLGDLVKGMLK